jgi:lysylphosphatidylglycerol synthetase-like protein (DUF2156 family)
VREAIRELPAQSEIRQGKLAWRGDSPVYLAGNRFLAIVVDLNHEAEVGREADVSIELGQQEWRIYSLLGYTEVKYPSAWVTAFNRAELEPWWGAWEPAILACTGMLVSLGLMLCWALAAAAPRWAVAVLPSGAEFSLEIALTAVHLSASHQSFAAVYGTFSIESVPGQGAIARIRLPTVKGGH